MPLILNGDGSLSGTSLQVDSPTFVVDHSNNRVGVGTSTPSHPLHVSGSISVSAANGNKIGYNVEDAFSSNSTTGAHYGMTFGVPSNNRVSISGWDGVHLWTGGASRLQVDGLGRVITPSQPAFNAWINTSSSSVASAGVLPFNTTIFNVGGHFSTSTNRFTAPVAGIYLFGITMADDDAAEFTGKIASFYLNGSPYRDIIEGETGNAAHWEAHAGTLISMSANDYVDVRMRSGSVVLNNGADGYMYRNSFYGYFLG